MTKVSKDPLISVIIPVYKVENYLDKCVKSVVNQTYKNLEIILVDDGSPDNCPKMCDEWALKDSRIKVIHKKNGGLSDARNKGIDIAKGEYITFIDSDDYVESEYVQTLYDLVKKYDVKLAASAHKAIYKNGNTIEKKVEKEQVLHTCEALKKLLYDDGLDLTACMKLFHKDLFKNIVFPKGRLYEDAATTYKFIIESNKIAVTDKKTYNYMIRDDSITNCNFNKTKFDLIKSTDEMANDICYKYKDLKKAANRRKVYSRLSTLTQLAMSKDYNNYKKEKQELLKYIKKNGVSVLKDRQSPNRDKAGILLANCGFTIFRISWLLYMKITRRNK